MSWFISSWQFRRKSLIRFKMIGHLFLQRKIFIYHNSSLVYLKKKKPDLKKKLQSGKKKYLTKENRRTQAKWRVKLGEQGRIFIMGFFSLPKNKDRMTAEITLKKNTTPSYITLFGKNYASVSFLFSAQLPLKKMT